MFDEIEFERIKRLPKYVFAEVNDLKMAERRAGKDVIDFSMGNPDGDTPEHIRQKLVESAQKTKTHGYSASKGIPKLLVAIADWYKRRYGVELDPQTECVATMGSKEGYAHLAYAITNPGDVAVVPDPTYPIHSYAFILAGGNVQKMPLVMDEDYNVDEEKFFENLETAFKDSFPKPKYVVVNFPHNPSTATVTPQFYERLVALAKRERFYIISDIAYGDITFGGYRTPSIMEVAGAKDVAVESFTLSKSYNMAGWRVGFFVGNKKLIGALQKIKSWLITACSPRFRSPRRWRSTATSSACATLRTSTTSDKMFSSRRLDARGGTFAVTVRRCSSGRRFPSVWHISARSSFQKDCSAKRESPSRRASGLVITAKGMCVSRS